MAEAIGFAAAITGLVMPTMHGIRSLSNDINRIKGAPKTVEDLGTELTELSTSVENLKSISEHDWDMLGPQIGEQCIKTMDKCAEACVDHRKVLYAWTKHSRDGTISWKSRIKIGFFKERHIQAMLGQMQSFKTSLASVVGVATFFVSIQNSRMTAEIKEELETRISDVSATAGATERQVASAEQALREVQNASIEDSEGDEEEEANAAEIALSDQLLALKTSEEMTKEFLTKLDLENVDKMLRDRQGNANTVTFGQNIGGIQSNDNRGSISGNTLEYAYPPGQRH